MKMEKEKSVAQPSKGLTATAVENMKRTAKRLRKDEGIPHHAALDRVAKDKGFASWAEVAAAAAGVASA